MQSISLCPLEVMSGDIGSHRLMVVHGSFVVDGLRLRHSGGLLSLLLLALLLGTLTDAGRILTVARRSLDTLTIIMLSVYSELEVLAAISILLSLDSGALNKSTLLAALGEIASKGFKLCLLSIDGGLALRRSVMAASRLSKELSNTLIRINRGIIVTSDNLTLDILLLFDLSVYVLCLLLAFHVASDFGLHARVSLNWASATLFLSSSTDLDVCDRLTDQLCALVLLEIFTGGAFSLVHQAKAAL